MNRFLAYMLFLIVAISAVAQVSVSGTVVDKDSNEPLTGASVIVKGADGKIKKYATSKGDGGFAMSLPSVSGCNKTIYLGIIYPRTIDPSLWKGYEFSYDTLVNIWKSPKAIFLYELEKYIDKKSPCFSCAGRKECYGKNKRCLVNVTLKYGDNITLPDPSCIKSI